MFICIGKKKEVGFFGLEKITFFFSEMKAHRIKGGKHGEEYNTYWC